MEPTHGLLSCLRNLRHLTQLVRGADCKVEETQFLKVLCLLVCNLDDAMVALCESGFAETVPRIRSIELASRLDCNV